MENIWTETLLGLYDRLIFYFEPLIDNPHETKNLIEWVTYKFKTIGVDLFLKDINPDKLTITFFTNEILDPGKILPIFPAKKMDIDSYKYPLVCYGINHLTIDNWLRRSENYRWVPELGIVRYYL